MADDREVVNEKVSEDHSSNQNVEPSETSTVNLADYYEEKAGSLVVDPAYVACVCPVPLTSQWRQGGKNRVRRETRVAAEAIARWKQSPMAPAIRRS